MKMAMNLDTDRKYIFIAGCGRSGTTLMRRLMKCFDDTYVYDEHEKPFTFFAELTVPQRVLVVKRTAGCWSSLYALPKQIELIYCVRHPFDTLTSKLSPNKEGYHIEPERWLSEFHGLERLEQSQPEREIIFVRYEDLVAAPDRVQQEIASAYALSIRYHFSKNPHNPKGIYNRSIRKWETMPEVREYLKNTVKMFLPELSAFCKRFRYESPDDMF